MSIDDQISAFAAQLDSWFVDFAAKLLQPGDEIAETKTRVAGLKLLKRFDDLKSQGLASLAILLNFADVASESDRTKTLLHGFERAARLEGISNDLQDWDGVKQIDHIMDDIVVALAAIGPGRTLLVPLLEHDNARVRVLAGRYLIDLMPDRVIPILERIDKEGTALLTALAPFWCSRLGKLSVEDDSARSRVEWCSVDPARHPAFDPNEKP